MMKEWKSKFMGSTIFLSTWTAVGYTLLQPLPFQEGAYVVCGEAAHWGAFRIEKSY